MLLQDLTLRQFCTREAKQKTFHKLMNDLQRPEKVAVFNELTSPLDALAEI